MAEGIFHLGEDGNLIELRQQGFINEDDFQELLARFPRLLPGTTSSGDGEPWLLIQRELSIPDATDAAGRWSLDHVFVDREGVPTLVEVKRSTDTRLRREVVGQMLDYAANAIVYWPVDRLRAAYESRCETDGLEATENLQAFLGVDVDSEAFWMTIKTNLQAGKVRMMFVADVIPKELQRIVEFLNEQMDPAEVLAVEMRQYVGSGTRSLVPQLIGRTAEAEVRKVASSGKPPTNESEFLARVRSANRGGARAEELVRRILTWGRRVAKDVTFGSDSFALKFSDGNYRVRSVLNVSCWVDSPELSLGGDSVAAMPPFDDMTQRDALLKKLQSIPGAITEPSRKSFGIRLAETAASNADDELLSVLNWFADEVNSVRTTLRTQ
ncbi:MAG: hypothetical protein M3552_07870 [Planctomycetota bacterium]|nr:hypothetical protein [Planctomycetota bacterium]